MDRIRSPKTQEEREEAADALLAAGIAGFDTESKPTFQAGEASNDPHVIQFALTDQAYIFQTNLARFSSELLPESKMRCLRKLRGRAPEVAS